MSKSVIIIGGGIIGLSTAYYLQKEGCDVTVIDKSNFSAGASYVNAGYITPSHFIPLSQPGIITKGLKWMFNPESPFYNNLFKDWAEDRYFPIYFSREKIQAVTYKKTLLVP